MKIFHTPPREINHSFNERKIRRDVREIIVDVQRSYYGNLPLLFKFIWLIIVVICILVTAYLIFDRVQYYGSTPTKTEMQLNFISEGRLPEFKFCSPQSTYLTELMSKREDVPISDCALPIPLLLQDNSTNYERLWDFTNVEERIHSFKTSAGNKNAFSKKKEISVFGQCTVFENRRPVKVFGLQNEIAKVQLNRHNFCKATINMMIGKSEIDFLFAAIVSTKIGFNLKVHVKKYNYLNLPNRKCVTSAELENCYNKCIKQRFEREVLCRLPFFNSDVILPQCDKSKGLDPRVAYIESAKILLFPDIFKQCNCDKMCKDIVYFLHMDLFSNDDLPFPAMTIAMEDTEMVQNEYIAYNFSNLFQDSFVICRLLLGLCILSFFEILNQIRMWIIIKSKQHDTVLNQLILDYVQENKTDKKKGKCLFLNFKAFGLVFCACLACFLIGNKLYYYLQEPIRIVINIESKSTIQFPSITFCGDSLKIFTYKKMYMKKNKLQNPEICNVDVLDTLGLKPKITLDHLWENHLVNQIPDNMFNEAFSTLNMSRLMPIQSEITTPFGICTHYKFSEERYTGFFSFSVIMFSAVPLVYDCSKSFYKLYFDDFNSESFNPLITYEIPIGAASLIYYRHTMINRLNTLKRPCSLQKDDIECKQRCLIGHLRDADLCQLPFLKNVTIDFKTCNNTEEMKYSRQKYLEILTKICKRYLCNCLIPCSENVYILSTATIAPSQAGSITGVVISAYSSDVEHFTEVVSYTLLELSYEIINIIVIIFGISIENICRLFINKAKK